MGGWLSRHAHGPAGPANYPPRAPGLGSGNGGVLAQAGDGRAPSCAPARPIGRMAPNRCVLRTASVRFGRERGAVSAGPFRKAFLGHQCVALCGRERLCAPSGRARLRKVCCFVGFVRVRRGPVGLGRIAWGPAPTERNNFCAKLRRSKDTFSQGNLSEAAKEERRVQIQSLAVVLKRAIEAVQTSLAGILDIV